MFPGTRGRADTALPVPILRSHVLRRILEVIGWQYSQASMQKLFPLGASTEVITESCLPNTIKS